MKNLFIVIIIIAGFLHEHALAQCSPGFDSVTIIVETNNNGYQAYWQLVRDSSACGNNVIFTGGNTQQINCNGVNANVATPGNGYASNDTIIEGPWCLKTDSIYSIQYIDDAGASDNFFICFTRVMQSSEKTDQ